MSKVVVLWSGGVDSTAALYDVLKNHRDIVFAHHIHFKNRERRWEADKDAVDKMLHWLRKYVRDFEYSYFDNSSDPYSIDELLSNII